MWINKSYLEARRKAKIKQRIIILELSHWAQRVGVQRAEFILSYAECIIYYNFLANIHIFVKSMLNMNHAASRHLLARQWNCGFCTFDAKMGRAESESEVANLFIILVNFHIFNKGWPCSIGEGIQVGILMIVDLNVSKSNTLGNGCERALTWR